MNPLAEPEDEILLLIDEGGGRLDASRRGILNTGVADELRGFHYCLRLISYRY